MDGGVTTAELITSIRRLSDLARRGSPMDEIEATLSRELIAALGIDGVHVHSVDDAHGAHATEWVAATGRPLVVPDARTPGTLPSELVEAYGIATAALLPLTCDGVVRAVVVLASVVPRLWPEEELELAATLVDLAAAALALHDAHEAARIDPLTGCLNHGAMMERLAEEVSRAERQDSPLGCMLLDLDDFKAVNDLQGHPAGDAVLRGVGESLRREYRSFDAVARYGGDEFLVILPNALGPRMDIAASRALRSMRRLGITCSVGCAQWEGDTVAELLDKADLALRSGKAAGKDTAAGYASLSSPR